MGVLLCNISCSVETEPSTEAIMRAEAAEAIFRSSARATMACGCRRSHLIQLTGFIRF